MTVAPPGAADAAPSPALNPLTLCGQRLERPALQGSSAVSTWRQSADGNIDGDPEALLRRVRELSAGKVLRELDPTSHDIADLAARAGLTVTDTWSDQGRVFAELIGKS